MIGHGRTGIYTSQDTYPYLTSHCAWALWGFSKGVETLEPAPASPLYLDPRAAIGVQEGAYFQIWPDERRIHVLASIDLCHDAGVVAVHDHTTGPEAAGIPERIDNTAEGGQVECDDARNRPSDPAYGPFVGVNEHHARPDPSGDRWSGGHVRAPDFRLHAYLPRSSRAVRKIMTVRRKILRPVRSPSSANFSQSAWTDMRDGA